MKTEKKSNFINSFMQDLLKASENEFSSIMDEESLSNTTDWIDTGSYALNGILCSDILKGIPNNKVIAFAGDEGTGKTYLALEIAKKSIEKGYIIAYFDSENSTEKRMVINRKIDAKKIMYYPVATVEDFRDQMVRILNVYNETSEKDRPKMLIILDSLGNLSTKKEIEDVESGSGKRDMTRASAIKSIFRVINLKLARAKIPMIITNHVYCTMEMFSQKEMSGGSGLRYASSIIIFLSKSKAKDADKNVTGIFLNARAFKNRFCKPESHLKIYLDFKKGLHPYYGLQEYGEPVLKKESKGWSINDKEVSEEELWNYDWKADNGLFDVVRKNISEAFSFGDDLLEPTIKTEEKENN